MSIELGAIDWDDTSTRSYSIPKSTTKNRISRHKTQGNTLNRGVDLTTNFLEDWRPSASKEDSSIKCDVPRSFLGVLHMSPSISGHTSGSWISSNFPSSNQIHDCSCLSNQTRPECHGRHAAKPGETRTERFHELHSLLTAGLSSAIAIQSSSRMGLRRFLSAYYIANAALLCCYTAVRQYYCHHPHASYTRLDGKAELEKWVKLRNR